MKAKALVAAEVVLKDQGPSNEEAPDMVADKLRRLGLKIVDVGPKSISIQAAADDFERLFACSLVRRDDKGGPAMSYGRIGGPALRPKAPLKVPSGLEDHIASIEVQEPPLMF